MRLLASLFGLCLVFASSAFAADAPKGGSDDKLGTSVVMPYLIAPLSQGDNLLGYAYVSCKIIGTSQAAQASISDKVPFIQDAFVRDVNMTSIGKPDDPGAVDSTVLAARLLALTKKVMGPGKVADLKLTQVQITAIRPGSIPQPPPSQ